MAATALPSLPADEIEDTRLVCHAATRVLGGWTLASRPRRKHWWQLSLRPSLNGARTGLLRADALLFELELDLRADALRCVTACEAHWRGSLSERTPEQLADELGVFLLAQGAPESCFPEFPEQGHDAITLGRDRSYRPEIASRFADVMGFIATTMADFQAGVVEESSPIMFWPGHFDLAMMWLPGEKIPGQDPADEEHSDKQMNFGFSFGDEGIPDPYFYVTAYPSPESFPALELPVGARWHTQGFSGVVLDYAQLRTTEDPGTELLALWEFLIDNGRQGMTGKE